MINGSEEVELLSGVSDNVVGLHLQHVESDGLAQGSALSGDHDVTLLHGEAGRAMAGDVFVSLLESFVFGHVVQVVSADDAGLVHLGGDDHAPVVTILT